MKIAIVTSEFFPVVSGVSRITGDFARYLSHKNSVTVYTLNHKNNKKYEEETIDNLVIKRHPFYNFFINFYYSPSLAKSLAEGDYDLVHSYHYGYYPATAGLKVAIKKNVPHIFSTFFHPPLSSFLIKPIFYIYNFFLGRPLLKNSTILAFSDHEKEFLVKFGAPIENIIKFPNPVDTDFFRPTHKKDKNPKTVLFIHRLTEHKGADKFFMIARKIVSKRDDVRFVVGGEGPLETLGKKLSKIEKKRIIFLGKVPENKLPGWYSRATVFVLPSRYESFSLTIAEALSCGTPIISTKVGAVPELIKDKKLGFLVDYSDWEKMSEYIEYFLDNEKIVEQNSKFCREYIKKNYYTNFLGKKLLDIYQKAINSRNI